MSASQQRYNVVVIVLFVLCIVAFGQENIYFRNYQVNNGLSNNTVQCIAQDAQGFIWSGTHMGLNRFDGYEFKQYVQANTGLSDLNISSLFSDSHGRLWVGSYDGIHLYLSATDSFRLCISEGLRTRVFKIMEGNDSLIYATSFNKGLLKLNEHTLMFTTDTAFHNHGVDLTRNEILTCYQDHLGNFWIGTAWQGLYCFDKNKQLVKHYSNLVSASTKRNEVRCVAEDENHTLWVGTYGSGLHRFNRQTQTFIKAISAGSAFSSKQIFDIQPIGNKQLLIIAELGLNIYNTQTQQVKVHKNNPYNPASLINNKLWSVLLDNQHNIWLGHYQAGLSYTNFLTAKQFHNQKFFTGDEFQIDGNNITAILQYSGSVLWLATDGGGIKAYNTASNTYRNIYAKPGIKNALPSNTVMSLYRHTDSTIWLGTYLKGLVKYTPATRHFKQYLHNVNNTNSLPNNDVRAITGDHDGNLWISTYGGGISKFNPQNEQFVNYSHQPTDPNSITSNWVQLVFIDTQNTVWAGTHEGLNRFNRKTNSFTHIVYSQTSPEIYDISQLPGGGDILVGTNHGLLVIDKQSNTVKQNVLTEVPIRSINFDKHHALWVSTANKGIVKLADLDARPVYYIRDDGKSNDIYNVNASAVINNQIYLGLREGLTWFNPDSIKQNTKVPQAVITHLKVFNKEVSPGEKVAGSIITNKAINVSHEITLTHKHNVFSLEFTALNYTMPDKNKYKYKLEGFDKTWVETTAKNRVSTYTNLKGGKYIFKVVATNSDNIWNDKPTELTIHVMPPIYKTWGFRIGAFVLLLTLTSIGVYMRISSIKRQNKALTEKVEERTSELKQKNIQLQKQSEKLNHTNTLLEERRQLVLEQNEEITSQLDELHELNAMKDKLFSIIAHDIKNPFNIILGFSEMLSKKLKDWDDDKKAKVIDSIYYSSKRIYKLLEQLLVWARSQSGKLEFKPQAVHLETTFKNVLEIFEANANNKHISLHYKTEPSLHVLADTQLLDTILRNLISNAIKFTNENGHITLSACKKNNNIEFSIADDGVGMPAEKANNLFRNMINKSTTGTQKEQGTGLGLLICRDFVVMHNGKIWAKSQPGKGSTFYFTIPVRDQI